MLTITLIDQKIGLTLNESLTTIDKTNHFVLSNANLLKLLQDHGASYSEWKEDCTRYNDPLEMLSWLGY